MTTISPVAQLGILLTRLDEQDRSTSRQLEDAVDQAAMRDANDRAAQLRAKADADESEALAKGIGDIAGGACTIGAAFVTPSSVSNPSGSCQASTAGRAIDWNAALNGAGKALPGVGEMVAGRYKGDADREDANAATFEALAQADARRYDRAQSDERAANDAIQKEEQSLQQIQQTENATLLSAATYRG